MFQLNISLKDEASIMQDIQYGIFILTTNIISLHSHVAISQNRDVSHVCYGHEALGVETSENLSIQIKCRDLRLSMYHYL